MSKEKNRVYKFTPEELGLERIVVDGRCYIDVTPLWLDSSKSREIQTIIEARAVAPENGAEKGGETE